MSLKDTMTSNERRTYQSLLTRGYTEEEALEAALDGVDINDIKEIGR